MKKLVSLCLAVLLLLCSISAVAEIDYHDYSQFPLVEDGSVTIRVAVIRSDADGTDAEKTWFWNWLEYATGIHFEVEQILNSVRDEKVSLMFASGDIPDLIYGLNLSTSELIRYGQSEGLLMDLSQYVTEDIMPNACAWFDAYPRAKSYSTAPDGCMYTFPWLYSVRGLVGESDKVFMNEKWANELGFDVPSTLDELNDMLYAMKENNPEAIPLGGGMNAYNPMFYIMNAYGYLSQSGTYGEKIALRDGKAIIPAGDATFKEVLKTMNQYYRDGIIAEDFFTMDNTKLSSYMAEGKLGIYPFVPFLVNNDKAFWGDWNSVKPLTSEYNDKQQWVAYDTVSVGNWAVSAESEYGELLARLADFLFSDIGTIYAWYGPMNGTDDCIGMTDGWIISEDNSLQWPEVQSGKFANTSVFFYQVTSGIPGGGIGNHSHSLGLSEIPEGLSINNICRYLYGTPTQEDNNFNLEEPGEEFRYRMLLNITPYEVNGFPTVVYYDEDTAYAMNSLQTVIDAYIESEVAKFIVGERDIEEFDSFVSELEALGLREYEGYYQAAYTD